MKIVKWAVRDLHKEEPNEYTPGQCDLVGVDEDDWLYYSDVILDSVEEAKDAARWTEWQLYIMTDLNVDSVRRARALINEANPA